jgi:hypothetical protein
MVEPRMHAVAVIFDFVEPLVAVRRRIDQLRELRQDPLRQSGRAGAPCAIDRALAEAESDRDAGAYVS